MFVTAYVILRCRSTKHAERQHDSRIILLAVCISQEGDTRNGRSSKDSDSKRWGTRIYVTSAKLMAALPNTVLFLTTLTRFSAYVMSILVSISSFHRFFISTLFFYISTVISLLIPYFSKIMFFPYVSVHFIYQLSSLTPSFISLCILCTYFRPSSQPQ